MQGDLEVWPGFYSAVQKLECGPVIQIDLTSKVIRKDNFLNFLRGLKDSGKNFEQINEQCKFMTVVTSYGNDKHTYQIDEIDFNKSPSDTFEMGRPPN